ncbi:MAG: 1-acyl-sn-glycerol-3-phosphate acyltransferase [Solirubrobacteraceae bacterium]
MPPAAVRRPLTVTAWLIMSIACLLLSPLLLALAAVLSFFAHRPQPVLFTRLVIAYFARELWVLLACGALWVLSGFGVRMGSRRSQRRHVGLLRWFVHSLAQRMLTLLQIDIVRQLTPEAERALATDRPLLCFSRHAGPGDTVLLIDQLLSHYKRQPSVVFKDTLAIDPCVDLIGHRLPHAVLDKDDPERCEDRIREVSARLGPRGVLVLFPEGGNFTFERRRRALGTLHRKGRRREEARGRELAHMLPPHPGGALAALRGNSNAPVLFAAHTGLGLAAFPRELWRHTPIGRTLKTRMWIVAPSERPQDAQDQVRWLYDWWKRLDDWVDAEGEEPGGSERRSAGQPCDLASSWSACSERPDGSAPPS